MGNASGRADEIADAEMDEGVRGDSSSRSSERGLPQYGGGGNHVRRASSAGYVGVSEPPGIPPRPHSPRMFVPQSPVTPLQRAADGPPVFNQILMKEQQEDTDGPHQKIIPTLLEWTLGGRNVYVEGSWDGWKSKRSVENSGKDHAILLGLPSGVYRYRFIVDGERRFLPDLPCETDNMGNIVNLHDVNRACRILSQKAWRVYLSSRLLPPRTLATVCRLLTRSSQRSLLLCQRSSTSVCSTREAPKENARGRSMSSSTISTLRRAGVPNHWWLSATHTGSGPSM